MAATSACLASEAREQIRFSDLCSKYFLSLPNSKIIIFFLFFTNGIIRKLSIFSEVSGLYQNSHREAVAYLLMVFIHFIWYIESW